MGSDAAAAVIGRILALAAALREQGVPVGVGQVLTAHAALAVIDPARREDAFHALRGALCSAREQFDAFDLAFAAAFAAPTAVEEEAPPVPVPGMPVELPGAAMPPEDDEAGPSDPSRRLPAAYSAQERLRRADFAALDPAQLRAATALLEPLARRRAQRPSRRTVAVAHRDARTGRRPDLRATVRRSLRWGGEPLERRWPRPRTRPRRLVFVLDVSGSMRPYAQALMLYLHGFVVHRTRVEAFVFGTRLTRVTRDLERRDAATALRRIEDRVRDWSGGTRIGAALAELNRAHGRRIGRGAVVVVLSDGWDRGDPAQVEREMARLARCAHRLVWLNPLKARPGYAPLTRGMQAALPHVDTFMAGNSVASLEALAELLEGGLLSA